MRGLHGAPDATPQVQFPGGFERNGEGVVGEACIGGMALYHLPDAGTLTGKAWISIDVGKIIRAGHVHESARLVKTGNHDRERLIARLSKGLEAVKLAFPKDFPPGVAQDRCARRG